MLNCVFCGASDDLEQWHGSFVRCVDRDACSERIAERQEHRFVSWVEAMSVLELKEGDRLVLKCARRITREQAEAITEHVGKVIPGHEVLILPPELDIGVLRGVDDG